MLISGIENSQFVIVGYQHRMGPEDGVVDCVILILMS